MEQMDAKYICSPYVFLIRDALVHIFGKFPKGRGVISDPKNFVADFLGNFEGEKHWIFEKNKNI